VVLAGKGIASGLPLAAIIAPAAVMDRWPYAAHGTTFGGNPLACVAALATLRIIEAEGLLERAAAQLPTLTAIAEHSPNPEVTEIRGIGAMIGIQLGAIADGRAKQINDALADEGVLATTPGGHTIRLLLPYAANEAVLREVWDAIARACARVPR
jgi:acetylornithine/succinyldiaminopimelate/putrescine aminotransferase